MGYTTYFLGKFNVMPEPLNSLKINYLNKFSNTRRMKRDFQNFGVEGEFYIDGGGFAGQDKEDNIIDYNVPPKTQPSLWCQWISSEDGKFIQWDGSEKFYEYIAWLKYIIENFLMDKYWLEGEVSWFGEDLNDVGKIICKKEKIVIINNNNTKEKILLTKREFKNDLYLW
jgi:hypothetical protein